MFSAGLLKFFQIEEIILILTQYGFAVITTYNHMLWVGRMTKREFGPLFARGGLTNRIDHPETELKSIAFDRFDPMVLAARGCEVGNQQRMV